MPEFLARHDLDVANRACGDVWVLTVIWIIIYEFHLVTHLALLFLKEAEILR